VNENAQRLLIVDDDAPLRLTLRSLLESDRADVVGEADNGCAAIEATERLRPDVVLLDISMPIMDGFTAARELHRRFPEVHIIFVSQNADRAYVQEAFRCGAAGYVLKQAAATELKEAIAAVSAGLSFQSRKIVS
jgi:two-component system, NarL family, response regulator LiaR